MSTSFKNKDEIIAFIDSKIKDSDAVIAAEQKRRAGYVSDKNLLLSGSALNGSEDKIATRKETFEGWIANELSEGTPKRSRDLFEKYKSIKPEIERKNFGSKLSIICGKKGALVKKYEIPGSSGRDLNIYCLASWFVGGKLKREYLEKIPNDLDGVVLE